MKIKTDYFLLIISPLFFAVITVLFTFSVDSTVIIAIFSSIVHELGHLIVLIYFKCKIKSVTLSFYGMKIIRESETSLDLKKEFAVCLAGVTVNFVIVLFFAVLYAFYNARTFLIISAVNLISGLFNLLPIGSLDGARALSCILEYKYGIFKSKSILKVISFCVLIPLLIFALYILKANGNFTLLICCIYLVISSYFLSD